MGRRRKHDRHLPLRMYPHRGGYRFHPKGGKPIPLGTDLGEALAKYATLIGKQWSGRTVGDGIDRYRLEVLPLKRAATTRKQEGAQLDRLKLVFGDMLPDSVTTQHCYRYADGRRDKDGNHLPSASGHEIKLLGHVFAKMIRWGTATHNPVRAMEKERRARKPKRYVSDAELQVVWALATERMRVAIELALLTGLRINDLISLTRSNLTPEGIVVTTSKTAAAIDIEITPALEAVIDQAKKLKPQVGPGNFLLRTRSGEQFTRNGFRSNWKRLVTKAAAKHGVKPFPFKLIRKKTASDMESVSDAKELLGHASEETTRTFYIAKPVKVRPLR